MSDNDLKALFKIIQDCAVWSKDVQHYEKAFRACHLVTQENIDVIKNCLDVYSENQ